jgi:uncharacterized protein (TIGR00251 family)
MESCYLVKNNLIFLALKAVPGASRSEFAGIKDGRARVRIAAAPEDGKANEALRAFLAKLLDCPKKDITISCGEKSRLKTVSIPLSAKEKLDETIALFRNLSF